MKEKNNRNKYLCVLFFRENNFYIMVILAIIFTIASLLIRSCADINVKNYSVKLVGEKIIPNLQKGEVKKIIIFKANGKRIVLDNINDNWYAANLFNYPANKKAIDSFLESLSNALVIQTEILNKISLEKLELDNNPNNKDTKEAIAAEIKLYDTDNKLISELIIGKRRFEEIASTGEKIYLGRYIKMSGGNQILFTDNQFVSTAYDTNGWLNKDFPIIKNIQSVQLSDNGEIKWIIKKERPNDKFYLNGNVKFNNTNASLLLNLLTSLTFNSIANSSLNRIDTGLNSPNIIIVKDFNGNVINYYIGKRKNNFYYVKIDPIGNKKENFYRKWIYLIDAKRIESILMKKSDFTKRKSVSKNNSFVLPIS